MKYFETNFEEYLISCEETNFHPKLIKTYEKIGNNNYNLVFYGPSGSGKYTQSLFYLSGMSPTNLKYEKRVCVNFNKEDYYFKISDIHIEIDMELLGCNAKSLWNTIYDQIIDIINAKTDKTFIVLCKNFDSVHNELLNVFYSYMQENEYTKLNYILLCENVAFIPGNILDRCSIISVPKPTSIVIKKKFKNNNVCSNLKNNYNNNNKITNKLLSNEILNNSQDFSILREKIYDILIYNQNEGECIYEILKLLSNEGKDLSKTYDKIYDFFKLYNNNYRPIYHLEKLILSIL